MVTEGQQSSGSFVKDYRYGTEMLLSLFFCHFPVETDRDHLGGDGG